MMLQLYQVRGLNNIMTNEVVYSKTHACRGCDEFAVIDAFKAMGAGEKVATATVATPSTPANDKSADIASMPAARTG